MSKPLEFCICGHAKEAHLAGHPLTSRDPLPQTFEDGVRPHFGACTLSKWKIKCSCKHFVWHHDVVRGPGDVGLKADEEDKTDEECCQRQRRQEVLAMIGS